MPIKSQHQPARPATANPIGGLRLGAMLLATAPMLLLGACSGGRDEKMAENIAEAHAAARRAETAQKAAEAALAAAGSVAPAPPGADDSADSQADNNRDDNADDEDSGGPDNPDADAIDPGGVEYPPPAPPASPDPSTSLVVPAPASAQG